MKKGEVWILEFPSSSRREQEGTRPAIAVSDTGMGMIVCIPLTSNLKASKFPHTAEIKKSEKNNLKKDSVALIFQTQSLDKRRFKSKIGDLEDSYLNEIDNQLKDLLKL